MFEDKQSLPLQDEIALVPTVKIFAGGHVKPIEEST
jgi:hypothetical protein